MRSVSVTALLALGLAAQQAAATGWLDAKTYRTPFNTDNDCTDTQSKGLSFDDHPDGDLASYGDLNWSNMKCTNGLSKRTFGDSHDRGSHSGGSKGFAGGKCASGVASKDVKNSPSFSCGPKQQGMSIDVMHISSSEDTEVELHYTDEQGVVCKQPASCSKGGSIIKNNQCGGAKSVVVKLPATDTKSDCEVGIHSVGFNCGPASSKPPIPSSTPVVNSSVVFTTHETKPYPIPTGNITTTNGPTGTAPVPGITSIPEPISIPETTSIPETSPIPETNPIPDTTPVPETTFIPETTPVPETTPISSIPESTTPIETTPAETVPVETTPSATTENSPASPITTLPVVTTE
ncbi:MAG: hypothetical protein L6R35_003111, partial [Caloplaca aegaea]